jgi:hypothetical protein
MATLDSSIPLQVRQPKLISPQEAQVRGIQLRSLARGEEQALQQQQEQKTIRDLYRQSIDQSGALDEAGFDRRIADAGLGDRLPDIQKDRATLNKTRTDTQATQLKLAKDRLDAVSGGLSSLLANPTVTHEDVYAQLSRLVDAGVITPEQGAAASRGLPGKPEALRPFLVQQALSAAEGSKRLDALLPKYDEQDRGGTINQGTVDNLTGTRTAGTDIAKTNTPGELLNSQNVQALAGAGVQYQTDADGNIIALPSKPGTGAITPRNVTDAGGANVSGKGLNDAQSKALLFGSRARDSAKLMTELEAAGTLTPSLIKQGAEKIPLIGPAAGMLANATVASPGEQKLEQAQRDFVNAVLRRESGAVISPQEFENAQKQYFPAIGDDESTRAQKARNRALAIEGLLAEVPEGKRNSIGRGATPAPAPAPGNRPPLDAIFGKRR